MRLYNIEVLEDDKVKEVITIKPVKRKDLADLIELNSKVLEAFFLYNGGIGSALLDNSVWTAMVNIAKLCPILGKETIGFDLSVLEDDYETLTTLFFPGQDEEKKLTASVLSELNKLDFNGEMGKALKVVTKILEQKEKDEKKKG